VIKITGGKLDPCISIENVNVLACVQVINGTLSVDFESVFVHLDIHRAPPNIILAGLLVNNSLVFGTTAGLLAREIDESTRGGDDGAFVADGIFVEKSNRGVAFDLDAIHFEPGLRKVL
jgi:hypothetical protein